MGSSKNKNFFDAIKRPPTNPNAQGIGASNSTYNVPVVSPYETQNYQPFFTQAVKTPQMGSYFNTYGNAGQPYQDLPYATNSGGVSPAVQNFATSASRVRFPML